MRVKLLSAIIAVCLLMTACSDDVQDTEPISYGSRISKADCFLCAEPAEPLEASRRKQDNVAILNLNTLEMMFIPINRYDDNGQLVESPAGYMQSLYDELGGCHVSSRTDPDRGYSHVQISGAEGVIDRSVEGKLCQDCLDRLNSSYSAFAAPSEIAVVLFSGETFRPLTSSRTWFTIGSYGVDCKFKDNGDIDLLVVYCPPRYE